jgi:possible phosphoprotein phosphatase
LEEGDLFFLCSDGLSNMVDHESMVQVLKDDASLEEKGQGLIDLANINGGKDNIALILVDPFGKE